MTIKSSSRFKEFERKYKLKLSQLLICEDRVAESNGQFHSAFSIVQCYMDNESCKLALVERERGLYWELSSLSSTCLLKCNKHQLDQFTSFLAKECVELKGNLLDSGIARVRFKRNGDSGLIRAILTIKLKTDTFPYEYNEEIDIEDKASFGKLFMFVSGLKYCISKERRSYVLNEAKYEFDLFDQEDLHVLEIEFNSEEEALNFKPWFDYEEDITFDKEYSNFELAKKAYLADESTIERELIESLRCEGRIATSDLSNLQLNTVMKLVEKKQVLLKKFDTDIYSKKHSRMVEYAILINE